MGGGKDGNLYTLSLYVLYHKKMFCMLRTVIQRLQSLKHLSITILPIKLLKRRPILEYWFNFLYFSYVSRLVQNEETFSWETICKFSVRKLTLAL